jgi:hypothetical protein
MKYIAIKGEFPNEYLDVDSYRLYLESVKDRFPSNALEYASASWHYDYTDPRCVHDAQATSIGVLEQHEPAEPGDRCLDIRIRLSDAIGDRWIEFRYSRVSRYHLSFEVDTDAEHPRGHGAWLLDEVVLTEDGHVAHEIQLERGVWRIECEDLRYSFGFNMSPGIEAYSDYPPAS